MASLICQKSVYSAQFYDRSRRPQRKRVPLQTRVRRDAERALRRMEGAVAIGFFDPWTQSWDPVSGEGRDLVKEAPPPEEPAIESLGDAVKVWLEACSHLRPSTIRRYRHIAHPFRDFAGADLPVGRVTPNLIHRPDGGTT